MRLPQLFFSSFALRLIFELHRKIDKLAMADYDGIHTIFCIRAVTDKSDPPFSVHALYGISYAWA